ncbi:hypothetical protein H8R29_11440 [Priestia megaterium]|uniref:Uncharacterized protein n=1 Tax=Priestia megaterium (strain ATCC 14581 / DSM 32 / CCUG 1817 / JCM 2506 / NBRC 15308 / NCIMB 9376 / NCTC 10342 / NRRL B-14308 / VKM B-512 / Ford 19) TaxID=1348623 RepID=A0A0B6APM4_PRIM2|nr:hypothetical protein [Priestia megaterium]AJI23062.1 hypothetical protein BG04_4575 [Priestia megaterium NBRC 15308 = ATCC 14581]KFM97888.1 hypothetical protein DJ91_694 [Priestia megaterium]KGJ73866.1 hypothetical protein BMT_05630 [Priestia megaterium NBRC 15308 = ATCC 14581]MDR4231331.1 hypothetical protein [Priestia megaterium]MED3807597.1 hypothetical protein [Priestia megaterium]
MNSLQFQKVVARDRVIHEVEKLDVECKKNDSMDTIFKILMEENSKVAEEIFEEYKLAGKTSLNVFEVTDYPQHLNSKKSLTAHIQKKLGIQTKVLDVKLNPQLTPEPQIYHVEEIEEGLRIIWVSGEEKTYENYYEYTTIVRPKYVVSIIRLGSPVFIEVRAGYTDSLAYFNLFKILLSSDNRPLDINHLPLTKVTEKEAEEIAEKLKAGLLEGEHLGSNGIGKYSISADRDTKDLRQVDEYTQNYSGKKYLAQTLNVYYEDMDSGYKTYVKFRLSMNGGFQFKTKVSEKIIKRIFDVFTEVRYKQQASGE